MGGLGSGRRQTAHAPGEGAYFGRNWVYFTPLIPLEQRVMPVTMDERTAGGEPPGCMCPGCQAYRAWDQERFSHLKALHRRREKRHAQMRISSSSATTVST